MIQHKSKYANKFFEENNIEVLEWPSQSPDLNVIEHKWSELKRSNAEYKASSKNYMIRKINEIWQELRNVYAKKLVDSIYKRCIEVINAKGGATRY